MKVATILPTKYLHMIKEDDYHMALAHLIGEDKEYTDFYREQSRRGAFIILDNGTHEGKLLDTAELIKRAQLVGAHEIILPDKLTDMEFTLTHGAEAISTMGYEARSSLRLMAVPQGRDLKEWKECVDAMKNWPVETIGIPKVLVTTDGPFGRWDAVTYVLKNFPEYNIHLLGCWHEAEEVQMLRHRFSAIRGVDSALPFFYAKKGLELGDGRKPQLIMSSGDTVEDEVLLSKNVNTWRRIAGGLK